MGRLCLAGRLAMAVGLLGALPAGRTAGGDDGPAGAASYRVVSLEGVKTGWIVGRCRITPVIERWTVSVTGNAGGARVSTERMVASADGGLANCVVFLKEIAAGKDWPESMRGKDPVAEVFTDGARYDPHFQVVRAETQIVIVNRGASELSCHAYFQTLADTQFDFALAPKARVADLREAFLRKPGVYPLRDDIHVSPSGYLYVVSHSYFALTSAEGTEAKPAGSFGLADVPPGEYEVVCWHEGMEEKAVRA